MMPSGHKAFLVSNVKDVELLLMHNKTYAAECVPSFHLFDPHIVEATTETSECGSYFGLWTDS